MVNIRTTNQLINNQIDFYRNVQPDLDTKPGTVARDVLIDGPASQISRLYEELSAQSNLQSLRLSIGSDLDRLGQNYGAIRQRGARSTGPALLTFNNLDADIGINKGDIITAKNGATFLVLNSFNVSTTLETTFRATAARFRADLDLVGITDQYAVEILVEAAAAGRQGNISKYSLNRTTIPGINNVTNASAFGGGTPAETDSAFRNRIFSIFSGANTGTELGYRNAARGDVSVIDVEVVVPGDVLMTRDGTEVFVAEDGSRTIISEGTGGKVDIYTFGTRVQEVIDTFIYRDVSNTGDPTNSNNNRVLGQISGDENKTVTRRRLENIENGTLPNQPASNIVSVTGSSSGSFVEKFTDELGRVTGNFELVKDEGVFGGSPFGFDALAWISDRISDLEEDKTKVSFNGQDPLGFTDVSEIGSSTQNLLVNNENSTVNPANRSSIQLAHFPVQNVTRVFNLTTGERYVVANQNPDGSGTTNPTGRIIISGQSLPAVSDTLQVDYTWVFSYDPTFDFDNRLTNTNPRAVQDSIDWGFSNAVRRERVTLAATGSNLTATVTHPISTVVSVNAFTDEVGDLSLSSGRVAFVTSTEVENVVSIVRNSDNAALWNTGRNDGSFSGFTIFLPTDTVGGFGEEVTVTYNTVDVFNADTQGNFNSNTITIVPSTTATAGTIVEANYIANVTNLLPSTTLANLPAIRSLNNFNTESSTNVGNQPTSHIFSGGGDIVQNLRQAPSSLALTVGGSISPGTFTISGTTFEYAQDVVFTVGTEGLEQTLSSAIRTYLSLNSNTSIPSNISVARVSKVERVTTPSTLSQEVTSVLQSYDIRGYSLLDNSFVLEESIQDNSLTAVEFVLPSTPDNVNRPPRVGDRLRVSFHIRRDEDSENVVFSRSGTLYTQKKFALIDTISISSGFTSTASNSATLTVSNLNQPATRSRYRVFYDYIAPKQNERITVRYNYNRLITDVTFSIEDTRPINADVLVKEAVAIPVDITLNVVVTNAFINNTETVRQNVVDAVTASLNAQELGTVIDSSDLISTAYTVEGVDRVRVIFFNRPGETGSVLSIAAFNNEYIQANTVTVNIETR